LIAGIAFWFLCGCAAREHAHEAVLPPDPVLADDVIKTEAEAISAAKVECERKHYQFENDGWLADLSGGTWIVRNIKSGGWMITLSKGTGSAVGAGCVFVSVEQVTNASGSHHSH